MAHIVEFSIKGLSGREDEINIRLNRDINVFFGQNGSGKTSLLKVLHSAMSNDVSILRDVPFTEARVVIYSINHKKNYEYRIKKKSSAALIKGIRKQSLKTILNERNAEISSEEVDMYLELMRNDMKWEISPKNDVGPWAHKYLPISRLYVGSISQKNESISSISEQNLDARFSDILQQLWMKYSFNINSRVREVQEIGLASILRELLSPSNQEKKTGEKIPPTLALSRVKKFLSRQKKKVPLDEKEFLKRYASESGMRSVVNDIDEVEKNIEQAIYPIERLNELIHQLFKHGKTVNFSGREITIEIQDGTKITPQQLSSGEKHLLKLLIEVLSVDESSIIIDEPELSMHIDWQKTLLQNMNVLNAKAQLIVATHSPEVMSKLDDTKIFRL